MKVKYDHLQQFPKTTVLTAADVKLGSLKSTRFIDVESVNCCSDLKSVVKTSYLCCCLFVSWFITNHCVINFHFLSLLISSWVHTREAVPVCISISNCSLSWEKLFVTPFHSEEIKCWFRSNICVIDTRGPHRTLSSYCSHLYSARITTRGLSGRNVAFRITGDIQQCVDYYYLSVTGGEGEAARNRTQVLTGSVREFNDRNRVTWASWQR